jgi:hypothetical protein
MNGNVGPKIFKVSLYEKGWDRDYLQKRTVVLAMDEADARSIVCKQWEIRKNAKGLTIEAVPYVKAKRVSKTQTELIHSTDYRPGLGTWDSSHYGNVTRCFCSACKSEVSTKDTFCMNCAAYLG